MSWLTLLLEMRVCGTALLVCSGLQALLFLNSSIFDLSLPLVSLVLFNYKGHWHLIYCLLGHSNEAL